MREVSQKELRNKVLVLDPGRSCHSRLLLKRMLLDKRYVLRMLGSASGCNCCQNEQTIIPRAAKKRFQPKHPGAGGMTPCRTSGLKAA